jgi:hypothetical protein
MGDKRWWGGLEHELCEFIFISGSEIDQARPTQGRKSTEVQMRFLHFPADHLYTTNPNLAQAYIDSNGLAFQSKGSLVS